MKRLSVGEVKFVMGHSSGIQMRKIRKMNIKVIGTNKIDGVN